VNELEKILDVTFPNNTVIINATNSTKKVEKNSIFFGLQGTKVHGSKYIEEALSLGASICIHDDSKYKSNKANVFYIDDLSKRTDMFTNKESEQKTRIYYFLEYLYEMQNTNKHNIRAFTGTNGKTSSAYLCHQLLLNKGMDSLYIGTIGAQLNNKALNNSICKKTTPDIFEFFEILNALEIRNNINICIEISSHALDQARLNDLSFFTSCLLNIGKDHLDYHKSIEDYTNTKLSIFNSSSQLKLINADLKPIASYKKINRGLPLTSISNSNELANVYYKIIESGVNGALFEVQTSSQIHLSQDSNKRRRYKFQCKLFPDFNIDNLIFAIESSGYETFSEEGINNLNFLTLPKGRTELVPNISSNVIIDYAHNAQGFIFFLSSIKDYFSSIVIVFGCGGERDKKKRPEMLKIAIKNAREVIFTSDNSRSEDFKQIFADSLKGNEGKKVIVIEDRKEAIIHGSNLIGDNDCLVILGKGHEQTQEINGKTFYFSDHEVVNEIYK
jgi:UDP-N-acetylmuramyl-tripeptide synthetase